MCNKQKVKNYESENWCSKDCIKKNNAALKGSRKDLD